MRVNVKVKPGSKKGPLLEEGADGLTVYIREPAVDGRANSALIKILAEHFVVPKTKVQIVRGMTSRNKIVEVII